jgi:hypothetical protein
VQRLCGNLQVDISKSCTLLGWNPPISVDEGLRRAVGGPRSCGPDAGRGRDAYAWLGEQ